MADTQPINRVSLTTSILDRYNSSPSIADVGGGGAKAAGVTAQTNAVDIPQEFSKQFQIKNPKGFTSRAEQYSTTDLKVPTEKYAPSGRR